MFSTPMEENQIIIKDLSKVYSNGFNALMQKAADDMLQLAKVMEEVDDIQATYKKLMWANCNACHSRYRKPH